MKKLLIILAGVGLCGSSAHAEKLCFESSRTIVIKNLNNQAATCEMKGKFFSAPSTMVKAEVECKGWDKNTPANQIFLNFEFTLNRFSEEVDSHTADGKKLMATETTAYIPKPDSKNPSKVTQEYRVLCKDDTGNYTAEQCDKTIVPGLLYGTTTASQYYEDVFEGFASKLYINSWLYKSNKDAPLVDRVSVDMKYVPSTPGMSVEHIIDGTNSGTAASGNGGGDLTLHACSN